VKLNAVNKYMRSVVLYAVERQAVFFGKVAGGA
jgi:hypothetical protein